MNDFMKWLNDNASTLLTISAGFIGGIFSIPISFLTTLATKQLEHRLAVRLERVKQEFELQKLKEQQFQEKHLKRLNATEEQLQTLIHEVGQVKKSLSAARSQRME